MSRRKRPDRQRLAITITPDLLERLHPGTHPLRPRPLELDEHRTVGDRSDGGGATSSVHPGATSDVRAHTKTRRNRVVPWTAPQVRRDVRDHVMVTGVRRGLLFPKAGDPNSRGSSTTGTTGARTSTSPPRGRSASPTPGPMTCALHSCRCSPGRATRCSRSRPPRRPQRADLREALRQGLRGRRSRRARHRRAGDRRGARARRRRRRPSLRCRSHLVSATTEPLDDPRFSPAVLRRARRLHAGCTSPIRRALTAAGSGTRGWLHSAAPPP